MTTDIPAEQCLHLSEVNGSVSLALQESEGPKTSEVSLRHSLCARDSISDHMIACYENMLSSSAYLWITQLYSCARADMKSAHCIANTGGELLSHTELSNTKPSSHESWLLHHLLLLSSGPKKWNLNTPQRLQLTVSYTYRCLCDMK